MRIAALTSCRVPLGSSGGPNEGDLGRVVLIGPRALEDF